MNTWHYEIIVRGTVTADRLTTERKMREELKGMYGSEAAEIAIVWRAGEERPNVDRYKRDLEATVELVRKRSLSTGHADSFPELMAEVLDQVEAKKCEREWPGDEAPSS